MTQADTSSNGYLEPTKKSAEALEKRKLEGEVVMLNLLKFRDVADYSEHPQLAPDDIVSGARAYKKYMAHSGPILARRGGEVIFLGEAGQYLVGPDEESWDLAMLVRYPSQQVFAEFTQDPEYLAGFGHRIAALEDSRLLPMSPKNFR